VLKPDGIVTFTFQHSREEAWLALMGALDRAKLQVVAAHPIKAEMAVATPKSQAKEPINLDIVFVCRPAVTLGSLLNVPSVDSILTQVREQVARLTKAGLTLSRGDLFAIAMSQFVAQCQRRSVLRSTSNNETDDEQVTLLIELRAALESLSVEDLTTHREVRQLRLFDEAAAYTTS
jgi:adenine-specific DNA methylase